MLASTNDIYHEEEPMGYIAQRTNDWSKSTEEYNARLNASEGELSDGDF